MEYRTVKIKKLHPDAIVPQYSTPGAAGFDLVAIETVILNPGETKLVKTGLAVEIPAGYEMQVRPRSGTSLKTTLRVANAPGTIDSDYRGEVCVIVTNTEAYLDGAPSYVDKGDRIAQGVIAPVIQAQFEIAEELSSTDRGAGGFGSTGK
jgi:dUTP pyrophosphatase